MFSIFGFFRTISKLLNNCLAIFAMCTLVSQSDTAIFSNSTTAATLLVSQLKISSSPQSNISSSQLFTTATLQSGCISHTTGHSTWPDAWPVAYNLNPYNLNPYNLMWPDEGSDQKQIRKSCSSRWKSSFDAWTTSVEATRKTSYFATSSLLRDDLADTPPALAQRQFIRTYKAETIPIDGYGTWTFAPSEPCCNIWCTVFGADAQVYRWPVTAPTPPITTLILDRFTFTSPSIYVKFEALYVTDYCGIIRLDDNATTLAFNPTELSTMAGYQWNTSAYSIDPIVTNSNAAHGAFLDFPRANWEEQPICTNITSMFWQMHHVRSTEHFSEFSQLTSAWSDYHVSVYCDAIDRPNITDDDYDHYTITQNPCFPTLSMPRRLLSLEPERWNGCDAGVFGFFDPPSFLTTASGFSTEELIHSGTQGAAPGPTPPLITASPTPPPEIQATPRPTDLAVPGPAVVNNDPAISSHHAPPHNPANPNTYPNAPAASNLPPPQANSFDLPINSNAANDHRPADGSDSVAANGEKSHNGPGHVTDFFSPDNIYKYLIGSQTLAPGSVATILGIAVSLQPDGSSVIVDGKTFALETYLSSFSRDASVVIRNKTEEIPASSDGPGQLVEFVGQTTEDPNVVIGSKTLLAKEFLAQITGDSKLIVGGSAMSWTAFLNGMTGDASVIVETRTVPLSIYLSEVESASLLAGTMVVSSGALGTTTAGQVLAGIIASIGGFGESPMTASVTTKNSNGQTGGNRSLNGTMFTGGSSGLVMDREALISGLMFAGATVCIILL